MNLTNSEPNWQGGRMVEEECNDDDLRTEEDDEIDELVQKQQKAKRNLNVQAAYLHILGGSINSNGEMIAALIIYFVPSALYMDPVCTYLFTIIVFYTTRITFVHCIRMLMECTPVETSLPAIVKEFKRINGVKRVHDLHVWSLSDGKNAISAHLECTFNDGT